MDSLNQKAQLQFVISKKEMSFVEKIKDNQRTIGAVVGGLVVGYLMFKVFDGRSKIETPEQRRKRQIQLFKKQINVKDPSFDDIRKVMEFAIKQAKQKVTKFSAVFKQKRSKFNKITRKQSFKQYITLIAQGIQQTQNIALSTQHNLIKQLGLNELSFKKYQKLVQKALEEMLTVQTNDIGSLTPMKVEDAKFALRKQIQFLKRQGLQYAQLIVNSTQDWTAEKRAALPDLISMIVNDGAFEEYPQIDADALQKAQKQFMKELMGEMQQLQVAMAPMMIQLNNAIKQISGFDLADFRDPTARLGFEQMNKLKQFERSRLASQPLF